MSLITITSGLTIKVPSAGTRNWAADFLAEFAQKISEHDHTGSGKGLQIATAALANLAVTAAKLASDAVTTAKILDANVTAAKLATDSVQTAKIVDLAVTTAKIDDLAVTAAKIANATITATQLASDAVTTAKILDANVTAAKLATDSVETAKIKDINVTTGKIADAAITAAKTGFVLSSWTTNPAPSSGTGTFSSNTVNYAKYLQLGKLVICFGNISVTRSGTGTDPAGIQVDLPVTAASADCPDQDGGKILNSTTYYRCLCTLASTTKLDLKPVNAAALNSLLAGQTYAAEFMFMYEAA